MPSTHPTDAALAWALLALLSAPPAGKSIDPADVPKRLTGETGPWRSHLKRPRAIAARLATEGSVVILRHGRPVAPEELRGVTRLARGEKFGDDRAQPSGEEP